LPKCRRRKTQKEDAMFSMLSVFVLSLPCISAAGSELPAFPGAEGFGSGTPGGRGGRVIQVTNLNDRGPGSLRAALEEKGPRIVVFRVGGVIELRSDLDIRHPFLTVAGQTAPGDGVCLKGGCLHVATHDVVLRYLRVRVGDSPIGSSPGNRDAIDIYGENVVLDHCSCSWALDETVTTWYGAKNVTIQWCIVSEGLMDSLHPQGSHSTGILLGNGKNSVTVHHCLLAHNSGRNPLIAADTGPSTVDWRNNVVYNYGSWGCGNARGPLQINYVGNTIIQGPNGRRPSSLGIDVNAKQRYFVRDNRWPGRPAQQLEEWMVLGPRTSPPPDGVLSDSPIAIPSVVTEPAAGAYQSVLRFAGAALPVRDVVDARIIEEVRTRTGAIIDTPADVGGWPAYRSARPPDDSDGDGMPDDWERKYGLARRDPADGPQDLDGDGYANVEEYLNATDPTTRTAGDVAVQAERAVQDGNERLRYGVARVAREPVAYDPGERKAFVGAVRASGKEVSDYLGLKFVEIPAGEFVKGWSETDIKVTLSKPFEIGAYEVTQAQWTVVMGAKPWQGKEFARDDPNHAATYVSWRDCQEFVARLNACGQRKHRLPTEAELDYGCLAGSPVQASSWLKGSQISDYAWHRDNSLRVGDVYAHRVGQKKPNPWGLYDTAGNVLEWCHDHFSYQYWRRGGPKIDPMGPPTSDYRELHVVRGGSLIYSPREILAEYDRSSGDPSKAHRPDYRNFDVGFRVIRLMP
jgi:formylglycine-generating enzyme required for sulfatase activity/pectate lyase